MRPVDKRKNRPPAKNNLSTWLDKIQQDSWQLELVISGVVIFLLLGAYPALQTLNHQLDILRLSGHYVDFANNLLFSFLEGGYLIVLLVFIAHLILRGFWIGAIGLRSVSGDFDFHALGFQPRFDNWLRSRLKSFDDFIERLEVRSSIAFSLGFLLFFAFASYGLFILFTMGLGSGINFLITSRAGLPPSLKGILVIFIMILVLSLVLAGTLYLIDFATLGGLKKRRWAQRFYFPIYRLLGWVTLARFYRPFYYNLIDHPFGRKLVRFIVPGIFFFTIVVDLEIGRNQFFPAATSGDYVLSAGVYLDRDEFSKANLKLPSLQSRMATEDYLEIFIPYIGETHNPAILAKSPDLPTSVKRSLGIEGLIPVYNDEVSPDTLLPAHLAIHRLYLQDSLLEDVPWKFYQHPLRQQPGLLYELPVYALPRGEYCLTFENFTKERGEKEFNWKEWSTICFLR